MTASSEIPEVDSNARYALRILLEIDSEQEQIAAQGSRASTKLSSPSAASKAKRVAPAAAGSVPRDEHSLRDVERDFHRREQILRRKLELQKWYAKYSLMLVEMSPEFQLGAFLKKTAGDTDFTDAAEALANLGQSNSAAASEAATEIKRILSEGEILRVLLPLLDPLPEI